MARSSSSRRWSLPKVLGGIAIAMIVGICLSNLPETGPRETGQLLLVVCPLAAYATVVIRVLGPMRRRVATLAWCVLGGILGVPFAVGITAAYLGAQSPAPHPAHGEDWAPFGTAMYQLFLLFTVAPTVGEADGANSGRINVRL